MSRMAALVGSLASLFLLYGCAAPPRNEAPATAAKRIPLGLYLATAAPHEGCQPITDQRGQTLYRAPQPLLSENDVRAAAVPASPKRALLLVKFDSIAAATFQRTTADHLGDYLVVLIDSAPVAFMPIWAPFTDPQIYIDGGFSRERAAEIVRRLNVPPTAPALDDLQKGPATTQSAIDHPRTSSPPIPR